MVRKEVPYTFQLDQTLHTLAHGGLLLASTRNDGKSNVMTIGWGTTGVVCHVGASMAANLHIWLDAKQRRPARHGNLDVQV